MKNWLRHKLLMFLGIEFQAGATKIANRLDGVEKAVGHSYVRWSRYRDYLGEDGDVLDRLLRLETKVFNKGKTKKGAK